MMNCTGRGECLVACECSCYDEDSIDETIIFPHAECTCGHRDHGGYCPRGCCVPVPCRNHARCRAKQPAWKSTYYNGICIDCVVQYGPHKRTTVTAECPICFDESLMILLKCKHMLCNDCWYRITETALFNKCPLCRNNNDWR
jgi:hypothetical protein